MKDGGQQIRRVVAISDLHIDLKENREWLERLCDEDHRDECLLLAGDLASGIKQVEAGLSRLVSSYGQVFFVPGNHDLWVKPGEITDSLVRFHELRALCQSLSISDCPSELYEPSGNPRLVILPIHSWYALPGEAESLFLPKPGEDPSLSMWADRIRIRWPVEIANPAEYFLALNETMDLGNTSPVVISFSHFLPRRELMFAEIQRKGAHCSSAGDRAPRFNFSRVAGSKGIDSLIRRFGSTVHIHGHQHRNRDRWIEGVHYLSYCLGYPQERLRAGIRTERVKPLEVWTG